MGTASKVFKRYGKYLTDPDTEAHLIVPKNMKVTHTFMVGKVPDPEEQINIK